MDLFGLKLRGGRLDGRLLRDGAIGQGQTVARFDLGRVDGAIAHRSSGRRKILTLALLAATALFTAAIAVDATANGPLGICQAVSLPLKAISAPSSFNLCADGVKHSGR